MKTGDLVKFNHQNHKRTGMKGLVVASIPPVPLTEVNIPLRPLSGSYFIVLFLINKKINYFEPGLRKINYIPLRSVIY